MSTNTYSDEDEQVPAGSSPARPKAAKAVAAVVAVAALVFGAAEITKSHSSSTATSAAGGPGAQIAPNGTAGARGGPPGGFGTPVTGATLTKLQAVATAKYPGTVQGAMKLSTGAYVVHVIQSSGSEVHVLVSKAFKVTGTESNPPAPPAGAAPPSGTAPQGAAPPSGQAARGTSGTTS